MSLARILPIALLLACGGKDPIAPPPGTGSGTGTGTGTGTGNPTGTEDDCADGTDNDSDGLLDCEDDDCLGDPACVEVDCLDGVDNDFDGYFDCADADCWGNGCAVSKAQITNAGGVSWREGLLHFTPTNGCSGYYLDTARMSLESPQGTVQYLSPNGGDNWVTCNWQADRSVVVDVNNGGTLDPFAVPRLLLREGFQVDANCPLQDERYFLPLVVTLDESSGMWGMRTGPQGLGPPWFGMTGAPTPYDSTAVSGPVHSPSSCSFAMTGDVETVTWSQADVGFEFTVAGGVDSSTTP